MPRKSSGSESDSRLPHIPSTNPQRRHVFGVTQQELGAILATVRRFIKLYLDINRTTTHQKDQLIQVENAVKDAYPGIFGNDEFKMRHLRNYIYNSHNTARSAHFKKGNERGGMGEVVDTATRQTEISSPFGRGESGEGDAAITDEGAGPSSTRGHLRRGAPLQSESQAQNTPSSSARQASSPPDSVGQTVHVHHSAPPRARRGRPPKRSGQPTGGSKVTSPVNASASTSRRSNRRVEVVLESARPPLAPTANATPPNPTAETLPNEDSDLGLKEVGQFLASACKPSLIHLLDHLAYYGCVNADFLLFLAGRAARLEEEEFHKYLRNHFSKGHEHEGTAGRRDLTEIEILVLTEGLLSLRGDK